MAVIKLNGENAMTKQGKRKASNKDIVRVIGGLINEIDAIKKHLQINSEDINVINGTLDLYIAYNDNGDEFKKYIDTAIDESQDGLQETRQDNTESDSTDIKD